MWSPTNWNLPAVSPTILACRILRVYYIFEVFVVIPNALDLRCNIAITIVG